MNRSMNELKFPIGNFQKPTEITKETIKKWVKIIELFPKELEELTGHLTEKELNWKYRPEGWSIQQVVNHCADSHMNSLIRFKLALTEDRPNIRPYYEDRWAELYDSTNNDISDALLLIKGLHRKWVKLLRSLSDSDLKCTFVHPEHGKSFDLDENIGVYAWHCKHHLAHIKLALEYKEAFN